MTDHEAFQRYVESRHVNGVGAVAVRALAAQATGAEPTTVTRVVEGVANEVYFVGLVGRPDVVIRVAPTSRWFRREAWALRSVQAAGVPVPTVLLVEDVELGALRRSVMVAERLRGSSLGQEGTSDDGLIADVADALAKMNSVAVEGWGLVDATGTGQMPDWRSWLLSRLPPPDALKRAAEVAELDPILLDAAVASVNEAASWENVTAKLVHGDFGPGHLIVDGGRLSGVVDWELAAAAHPTYDLAYWHFFVGDWIAADQLAPAAAFTDVQYARLFELHRVLFSLRYLQRSTVGGGYSGTLRFVLKNLPDALNRLR